MNNRRLTIVKNEKKQVLIFPLRRYFLEATKERNRKKNVYIFFLTTKKARSLETKQQGKASEQMTRGKTNRATL